MIYVFFDSLSGDEKESFCKKLDDLKVNYNLEDCNLDGEPLGIYSHVFIDIGGISLPGMGMLYESIVSYIKTQIEENPNTWFIFISTFEEEMEIEFTDQLSNKGEYKNMLFKNSFMSKEEIQEILNK
jgi:hypothetical protein